jgi:signal-transduction protein with cAMP-binding, CBS, and nucleotidyltransferase domain
MYQEYADKQAGDIADTDVLIMDESTCIEDAARAMKQKGVLSVIVSRNAPTDIVGIVTERDILYRVVAEHRSPFKTVLKEVMSSPVVSIDEAALVKDAIVLMRKNGIRRLPVMKDRKIIGMLTLMSVMGGSQKRSIELIAVELPAVAYKVPCPYCGSKFENNSELSQHIDRLHLGSGLLEGDLRQW